MPITKRFRGDRDFQNSLGLLRGYNTPVVVKNVNTKLVRSGFAPMSFRSTQLLGNLAKQGLYNSTCVCHWMARNGVTESSTAVSKWLNIAPSSVALNKNLEQTTAANMPTLLMHDGGLAGQYGYTAVVADFFSTPDSAAVSITGDIDIRVQVAMADWTPGTESPLFSKWLSSGTGRSYQFNVTTAGLLKLFISTTGSDFPTVTSSVATGFIDGTTNWVRVTRAQSSGATIFYTSTDGANWIQLGTTQTLSAGNAIFDNATQVIVGSADGSVTNAKFFRAQIYNGIAGTLAFDFNPATYTSGTTFTDSSVNAATITLNGGAAVITVSALYFDGTNDSLKTGSFTLNQPETVYLVGKQVSWTLSDNFLDGSGRDFMGLTQGSSTPSIQGYAGGGGNTLINQWTLQTNAVVAATFVNNNATLQINNNAPNTNSNLGTNSASGVTLGSRGDGVNFANFLVSELMVYNTQHNAAQRAAVINYLMTKYLL